VAAGATYAAGEDPYKKPREDEDEDEELVSDSDEDQ
jgi:hypothetical protein